MSFTEIAIRCLGGFYVFAGFVLAHVVATGIVAEQALQALTGEKPTGAETRKTIWSVLLAFVVFMGGLSLALLYDFAVWLYLGGALLQAIYLALMASKVDETSESDDARGRRQTKNAFILYVAATTAVVWAWQKGLLVDWWDSSKLARSLLGGGFFAFTIYFVIAVTKKPASSPSETTADDDGPLILGPVDPSKIRKLRIMAAHGEPPLWSMDEDNLGHVTPEAVGLSPELTRDLYDWGAAYSRLLEAESERDGQPDDDAYRRHYATGRGLAERVAQERRDLEIYVQDPATNVVRVEPSGAA